MMLLPVVDIEGPQRHDVELACSEIIKFYADNVAKIPPLGVKPVYIHQGPVPRTYVDPNNSNQDLRSKYNIDLACLEPYYLKNAKSLKEVVYQFGHELGHVYLFPHNLVHAYNVYHYHVSRDSGTNPNNWLIESCCCALSYICLKEIGKITKHNELCGHRIKQINDAKKELKTKLDLPKIDPHNWIQSKPPLLTHFDSQFWAPQLVCASEIEKILTGNPKTWGAFCFLGDATNESGTTDYKFWKNCVTLEQKPLVDAFEELFD